MKCRSSCQSRVALSISPQPSSTGVLCPSSFFFSGVYDDPACKNGMADLDHTVLATGYGTDPVSGLDYWIVRNSVRGLFFFLNFCFIRKGCVLQEWHQIRQAAAC